MAKSGVLQVKIVGDSKPLQKTMKGIGGKIGKFAKNVAKIGAIGAGIAAAGMAKAIQSTAAYGDRVAKTSRAVGLGIESFQELEFALGQMGLTQDQSSKALEKLNVRIGRAAQGEKTYQEAVEATGASLRDSNGEMRSQDEIFNDVLSGLGEMESSQERAAVAADLFGTSVGPKLATAMESGEEGMDALRQKARDLGIVMDKDTAESSERFTDAMDDLKKGVGGAFRSLAADFIPVLADKVVPFVTRKVIPALRSFGEWLGPKLKQAAAAISGFVREEVVPVLQALSTWWDDNGPTVIDMAKRMARTVQRVLGRAFEAVKDTFAFVNRNSEVMIPLLGGILAGFLAFKAVVAVIKTVQAVTKAWTAAQALLNVALTANPIGLVIAAIAGLVAIVVIAWKRSETFRRIVRGAFDKVKQGAFLLAAAGVRAFRTLLDFWLGVAEGIVTGAAKAFGWVPGLGDKLKGAERAIKGFREDVNRELGKVERNLTVRAKTVGVSGVLANLRGIQREVVRTQSAGITVATSGGRGRVTQFHTGGVVSRGGVAEVAEKERVLTADQNRNLEQIASGTGGGKTEVNITFPGGMLLGGPDELRRAVQEALREFERRSGRTALAGFGG